MSRFDQMTTVTLGDVEEAQRTFTRWTYAEIGGDADDVRRHRNHAMSMDPAPRALFEYMTDAWTDHRIWGHDPTGLQRAQQRRTSAVAASEVRDFAEQLVHDLAPAKLTVRMAVARTLAASDSAAMATEGFEPGTWAALYDEDRESYMKLSAGLVESGLIAWPPAAAPAPINPAAAEALSRVIHDDIDAQWPNWTDLPEHARATNREYVQHLDAAGLLDHTAVREATHLTEEEN